MSAVSPDWGVPAITNSLLPEAQMSLGFIFPMCVLRISGCVLGSRRLSVSFNLLAESELMSQNRFF